MNASIPKYRKSILLVAIALLALIGGLLAGWMTNDLGAPKLPQLRVATALADQAKALPPFKLVDDAERSFDKADLKGHWSLLFFGYTHCPDICPTTLSTLNQVVQSYDASDKVDAPQVIFVSVDPERDSPDKLRQYVKYFNPKFTGVTGNPIELNKLTRALGILHMRLPNSNNGDGYLVDHSTSILLIDPKGALTALFSAPHRPALIAADLRRLRDHYEQS